MEAGGNLSSIVHKVGITVCPIDFFFYKLRLAAMY